MCLCRAWWLRTASGNDICRLKWCLVWIRDLVGGLMTGSGDSWSANLGVYCRFGGESNVCGAGRPVVSRCVSLWEVCESWSWWMGGCFKRYFLLQFLKSRASFVKSPLTSCIFSSRTGRNESVVGDRGLSISKVVRFLLKMRILPFLLVYCVCAYTHLLLFPFRVVLTRVQ